MSINSFLSAISARGGMSYSNNYIVAFENVPISYAGLSEEIEYFCDEAQLPNINTATGTINGLYTGLGNIDYPHTKVFTELQLGFMLDADLSVLKYLNAWYNSIFIETGTSESRSTRVKFRNEYTGTIKITKSETGPDSTTQRKPITYVLEQAYPYAIDSVPLQFGSSQITKVTAQFKYQRHYTVDRNIRNIKDSNIPASGVLVGEVEIGPGIFTQQWLLPNGKIVEKRDNKVGTGTQPTAR
mgnify:CR=1 FL=1